MLNVSQQISDISKQGLQSQFALLQKFGQQAFASTQKIAELSFSTTKTILQDGNEAAQHWINSKHPFEFKPQEVKEIGPGLNHILAYERELMQILTKAQADLLAFGFAEVTALQNELANFAERVRDMAQPKNAANKNESTANPKSDAKPVLVTEHKPSAEPATAQDKPSAESATAQDKPATARSTKAALAKAPAAAAPATAPAKPVATPKAAKASKAAAKPVAGAAVKSEAKPTTKSAAKSADKPEAKPAQKNAAKAKPAALKAVEKPALKAVETPALKAVEAPAAPAAQAAENATASSATTTETAARPRMPRPHLVETPATGTTE